MLIQCPECQGQVSNAAENCPHCGYPVNRQAPPPPKASPPQSLSEVADRRPCPYCRHLVKVEATRCTGCLKDIGGVLHVICPKCGRHGRVAKVNGNTACDSCHFEFDVVTGALAAVRHALQANHRFIAQAEAIRRTICPNCGSNRTYQMGPPPMGVGQAILGGILGNPGYSSPPMAGVNNSWRCSQCGTIWLV